jgi:hypothetical protein
MQFCRMDPTQKTWSEIDSRNSGSVVRPRRQAWTSAPSFSAFATGGRSGGLTVLVIGFLKAKMAR